MTFVNKTAFFSISYLLLYTQMTLNYTVRHVHGFVLSIAYTFRNDSKGNIVFQKLLNIVASWTNVVKKQYLV
jgi:hypothetical protein